MVFLKLLPSCAFFGTFWFPGVPLSCSLARNLGLWLFCTTMKSHSFTCIWGQMAGDQRERKKAKEGLAPSSWNHPSTKQRGRSPCLRGVAPTGFFCCYLCCHHTITGFPGGWDVRKPIKERGILYCLWALGVPFPGPQTRAREVFPDIFLYHSTRFWISGCAKFRLVNLKEEADAKLI